MKLKVDFNRDSMQGQMRPSEREAMYHAVVERQPKHLLEIGTWKGGGSTYILSAAAYEYGGLLHSIEIDKALHDSAVRLFHNRMQILEPHVRFYLGDAMRVMPVVFANHPVDFVFFDGAEDPDQTTKQYEIANPYLSIGSFIACHDWKISKMAKLRLILEADNTWHKFCEMLDTDTGFAMWERRV